ncbi:MAG: AmmeMemoRadiSam system protein B [bacterium]|nr:AmmeMemoRadiSam system protein B [bacterium]
MNTYPRLRYLDAFPIEDEGRKLIYLRDPEGYAEQGMAVPYHVYYLLTLFDGTHSVADLQEAYASRFDGVQVQVAEIEALIGQMDEAFLLESERFEALRSEVEAQFRSETVRKAAHAGASYPEEADELRRMIDGFFEAPEGPGLPGSVQKAGSVRALIAPHIDFNRGGPCFAWAYRALAEAPPADLFVILGTGHSARQPFVLTRKDFETPLGTLKADREVIDRIGRYANQDLFEDETAHRTEHSIEFQTVFLKYLYPDRDISFVPILCGSLHGLLDEEGSPSSVPLIRNFQEALKRALQESGKEVCFIAGVDFSHVGAQFGDADPLSDAYIAEVEKTDRAVLAAAETTDADAFFNVIRQGKDRTRICGTSSIYTMLNVLDAQRGELLKYDQAVDLEAGSVVSFASMVFC